MNQLERLLNQEVVLDLKSPYVCLGKLISVEGPFWRLADADLHDLRDSPTTRENYVAAARLSGIKRNRKDVLIAADEIVAAARFKDVVDADDTDELE